MTTIRRYKNLISFLFFCCCFFLDYHATPPSLLKCAWWWRQIMGQLYLVHTILLSVLVQGKTLFQASPLDCSQLLVTILHTHEENRWAVYLLNYLVLNSRATVSVGHWMQPQSNSAKHLIAACCLWSLSTRWRRTGSWSWALVTESNQYAALFFSFSEVSDKKNNFIHINNFLIFFQINNPDMRVQILKDFVKQHFPSCHLLDYALDVEKITTSKVVKSEMFLF